MKNNNQLQERAFDPLRLGGKVNLLFGKTKDGQFVVIIDSDKEIRLSKNFFKTMNAGGFPIAILFKDQKDISKLTKINTTVDTKVYQLFKGKAIFRSMKILKTGTAVIDPDSSTATLIIKKINLSPFKKDSVFVVRKDMYASSSSTTKTTNEVPAKVYYSMKEQVNIRESAVIIIGSMLAMYLAMIFSMFGLFILASKINIPLGKKLNKTIKDGKNWKVYVIKEDSPNAFCMILPVMFLHSGLLKMLSEREVMAVMLHEAGHIKDMAVWKDFAATSIFYSSLLLLNISVPILFFILFILLSTGAVDKLQTRLLGRRMERKADNFAVKHGYGDELISALTKMEKWVNKQRVKRPCGKVCQFERKISDILDEHPPMKKRVEDILKQKETWEKINKKISFMKLRNYFEKKLK